MTTWKRDETHQHTSVHVNHWCNFRLRGMHAIRWQTQMFWLMPVITRYPVNHCHWKQPPFYIRFDTVTATMSNPLSPTDYDSLEIQQQYNDINNRWDLANDDDWDNENSSARLFERSRIKALAAAAGRIPPVKLGGGHPLSMMHPSERCLAATVPQPCTMNCTKDIRYKTPI